MILYKAVHIHALTRKAERRICHYRLGRLKAAALVDRKAKALRLYAGYYSGFFIGVDLCCGVVAAAVNKIKAVDVSAGFRRAGAVHHKERICPVRRTARPALVYKFSGRQGDGVLVHLPRPSAVKGSHAIVSARKIKLRAHKPEQIDPFFPVVYKP